jgi:hypothetical protein
VIVRMSFSTGSVPTVVRRDQPRDLSDRGAAGTVVRCVTAQVRKFVTEYSFTRSAFEGSIAAWGALVPRTARPGPRHHVSREYRGCTECIPTRHGLRSSHRAICGDTPGRSGVTTDRAQQWSPPGGLRATDAAHCITSPGRRPPSTSDPVPRAWVASARRGGHERTGGGGDGGDGPTIVCDLDRRVRH